MMRPASLAELRLAVRDAEAPVPSGSADQSAPTPVDSIVVVVGAHQGVGASTVALALADASANQNPEAEARLIDLAEVSASGLLGAADRELGREVRGWRLSYRGHLVLERSSRDALGKALRDVPGSRVVVDVARPVEELMRHEGALRSLLGDCIVVVTCRATIPGVRHVERALNSLPGTPHVVAVGVSRWPGPVTAAAGPLTRAAYNEGRCHCLPADRRLAVEGIDDRPLPRPVLRAASRLLDAVTPGFTEISRPKKGLLPWR